MHFYWVFDFKSFGLLLPLRHRRESKKVLPSLSDCFSPTHLPVLSLCWHFSFHQTYVHHYATPQPPNSSWFVRPHQTAHLTSFLKYNHNLSPFLSYIMPPLSLIRQIFSWVLTGRKGFQLHDERAAGKAIRHYAHQDLMGTACAPRMKLPSLTLDHPFQVSNCLSEFNLLSVFYKFIHVYLSCQKVKYVEQSSMKSYDSRANVSFFFFQS